MVVFLFTLSIKVSVNFLMIELPVTTFFRLILMWFFGSLWFICHGQSIKSNPFFLDPSIAGNDENNLSEFVEGMGIINFGIHQLDGKNWSTYLLELRRPDLDVVWQTPVRVKSNENFLHLKVNDDQVGLISVLFDEKLKQSQLHLSLYNLEDGSLVKESVLSEHIIQPWQEEPDKGARKQNFENIILSGLKTEGVAPLEYRYYLTLSPDKEKLLAYRYDYSQQTLYAEATIFNNEWQEEKKVKLPIDKNFVNTGLFLNNSGKIFLLNSRSDGTIAVIKVNLIDNSSKYLEISPSNSLRNSFNLDFEDDDHLIISNLSYKNGQMAGLMFSKFNFKENQIDWIKHQDFHKNITVGKDTLNEVLDVDHKNFELVKVYLMDDSKTFILEHRDYIAAGQPFNYLGGDHISNWKPRKAKILTGDLLVLNFDAEQELNWLHVINKNQSNSSDEQLAHISYVSNILEGRINLLYATGIGSVSKLNYINFNIDSGDKKIQELPNLHHLVFIKNYTQWLSADRVVLVGKKGFKGKSALIIKYKI
jgi:hypothetical protein